MHPYSLRLPWGLGVFMNTVIKFRIAENVGISLISWANKITAFLWYAAIWVLGIFQRFGVKNFLHSQKQIQKTAMLIFTAVRISNPSWATSSLSRKILLKWSKKFLWCVVIVKSPDSVFNTRWEPSELPYGGSRWTHTNFWWFVPTGIYRHVVRWNATSFRRDMLLPSAGCDNKRRE
jgi:hypothetical protein